MQSAPCSLRTCEKNTTCLCLQKGPTSQKKPSHCAGFWRYSNKWSEMKAGHGDPAVSPPKQVYTVGISKQDFLYILDVGQVHWVPVAYGTMIDCVHKGGCKSHSPVRAGVKVIAPVPGRPRWNTKSPLQQGHPNQYQGTAPKSASRFSRCFWALHWPAPELLHLAFVFRLFTLPKDVHRTRMKKGTCGCASLFCGERVNKSRVVAKGVSQGKQPHSCLFYLLEQRIMTLLKRMDALGVDSHLACGFGRSDS